MKRITFLLLFTLISFFCLAQDTLIVNNQDPLPVNIHVGDTIKVNDFSLIIKNIEANNSSGRGDLYLPFYSNLIEVTFTNLKINDKKVAKSGNVVASLTTYQDENKIQLDSKEADWFTPNEPIDEWNKDGIHSITNKRYNQRGFDKNGRYIFKYIDSPRYDTEYDWYGFNFEGKNHYDDRYNYDECDQFGFDKYGNNCDIEKLLPDYWGRDIELYEVIEYYDSIRPFVNSFSDYYFDSLKNNFSDTLTHYKNLFSAKQSKLFEEIRTKNISDPSFIFGPDSTYVIIGMSKKMDFRPRNLLSPNKKSYDNLCRIQQELYDIDQKIWEAKALVVASDNLLNDSYRERLLQEIDYSIRNYQGNIDKIRNEKVLKNILRNLLLEEFADNVAFINPQVIPINQKFRRIKNLFTPNQEDPFHSIASNQDILQTGIKSTLDLDYINYALQNHYTFIHNKNVAFYIEKLIGQRTDITTSSRKLPIIIKNSLDGNTYNVMISKIEITPNSALLNAHLIVDEPGSGSRIVFQEENIPFTQNGPEKSDKSKLKVKNKTSFSISNSMKAFVNPASNTYATWDKNGIKEISALITVELDTNYIAPVDSVGKNISKESGKLSFDFQIKGEGWSDYYGEINIEAPFVIQGYNDIHWNGVKTFFDYSDLKSPKIFSDREYNTAWVKNGEFDVTWQGLYFEKIQSTLPQSIIGKNMDIKTQIGQAIIDQNGFSSSAFHEKDIVPFKSKMNNWVFSMDRYSIQFRYNDILYGSLNGLIHIPLFKNDSDSDLILEKDCFQYEGSYTKHGRVNLFLKSNNELKIPMWSSDIQLNSNSCFRVIKNDTSFSNYVKLHGNLDIRADSEKLIVKNLEFQNLLLLDYTFKADWAIWGKSINAKTDLGGFQIKPLNTSFRSLQNEINELTIYHRINLSEELELSPTNSIDIKGKLYTNKNGNSWWKNDTLIIGNLYLNHTIKNLIHYEGSLKYFKENTTYGNGFCGKGSMHLFSSEKNKIPSKAIFGVKNNINDSLYHYFSIHANLKNNSEVDLFSSYMLKNFKGGMSHRMSDPVKKDTSESFFYSMVPNPNEKLKVEAKLNMTDSKPSAMNTQLMMNARFHNREENKLGGIDEVIFTGPISLINDLDPLNSDTLQNYIPNKLSSKLFSDATLELNLLEKSIDGNPEFYIHETLSNEKLNTSKPYGLSELRAGLTKNHILIKKYYDTPSFLTTIKNKNRIKAEYVYLGNTNLAKNQEYIKPKTYRIGTELEKLELPNTSGFFSTLAQYDIQSWKRRSHGILKNITFNTKENSSNQYLLFYDPKKLDEESEISKREWQIIKNSEGNLQGSIEYQNLKIAQFNTPICIEVQSNNSSTVHELSEHKFNILGWNLSLHSKFLNTKKINKPITNESSLQLIAGSYPNMNQENVTINSFPAIYFNYPIDKEFFVIDKNGFKSEYKLEAFNFEFTSYFRIPSYKIVLSENRQIAYIQTNELLGPNADYQIEFDIRLYKGTDIIKEEKRKISFRTGDEIDVINKENVAYSYPYQGMSNFYLEELGTEKGFLLLENHPYRVFTFFDSGFYRNKASATMLGGEKNIPKGILIDYSKQDLYVRFTDQQGQSFITFCEYDTHKQIIQWDMPKEKFVKGNMYKLEIMANNDIALKYPIYTIYFRVSHYDTFARKIEDYSKNLSMNTHNITKDGIILEFNNKKTKESFSSDELANCIFIQSKFPENWYSEKMKPFHSFLSDNYIPKVFDRLDSESTFELMDYQKITTSLRTNNGNKHNYKFNINNYSFIHVNSFEQCPSTLHEGIISEELFNTNHTISNNSDFIIIDKALSTYVNDFNQIKFYIYCTELVNKKKYGSLSYKYNKNLLFDSAFKNRPFDMPSQQEILIKYKIPGSKEANLTKVFKIPYNSLILH